MYTYNYCCNYYKHALESRRSDGGFVFNNRVVARLRYNNNATTVSGKCRKRRENADDGDRLKTIQNWNAENKRPTLRGDKTVTIIISIRGFRNTKQKLFKHEFSSTLKKIILKKTQNF